MQEPVLSFALIDLALIVMSDVAVYYASVFACGLFGAGTAYGFYKVRNAARADADAEPKALATAGVIDARRSVELGRPRWIIAGDTRVLFMTRGESPPRHRLARSKHMVEWLQQETARQPGPTAAAQPRPQRLSAIHN